MNDDDRQQLVDNDEGLYELCRSSGLSLRDWIRQNRALIDGVAENVQNGTKRQHHLKYGS